ncbi:SagB-type dehydrogenase domain-containing protein [Seinonella peptonophila]|uniref:SagB-type dehydrogenase domain-containing protein n=1 Tax=Seinonella peptonophila TaxID=112248 RepID=A0A1M4TYZ9_9BACL|nr:SagB family peptide dehydrogenase [Seinonella peptonophila]SHE49728.1 SagB-type dehydrogenase domain-containing protein [Seinonella peptonophila]
MDLHDFLYHLHFKPEKIYPDDWEVDWENAPIPYKLYQGLPTITLPLDIPLNLKKGIYTGTPNLHTIGHFLWYVYGISHICQTSFLRVPNQSTIDHTQYYRRFVPSGGALYPNELYIYLKMESLPVGIYHYDVAHHCLVLLREGNVDDYLDQTLGNQCAHSSLFSTVFVTTRFEKNFFKYHNFSYRLQALDAGALMGQLLEVVKRFGFSARIHFQFLDQAVNHLLGLNNQEEVTYTVIPLSTSAVFDQCTNQLNNKTSFDDQSLCREIPVLPKQRTYSSVKQWTFPEITLLNKASSIQSTQSFRFCNKKMRLLPKTENPLSLPPVKDFSFDWLSVCQKRYSPGLDFTLKKIKKHQLAILLHEACAAFVYANDLDEEIGKIGSRLSIYCCLYQVEDIPNGAYYYDPINHELHIIRLGDHRLKLQQSLTVYNMNLYQVPVCVHVVGDKKQLQSTWGYRGYRIQQMEAGMLVQRLLLTASSLDMGGHPLLGFDVQSCDELYQLDSLSQTSLIQVPIGPFRPYSRLTGGLHE